MKRITWRDVERILGFRVDDRRRAYFLAEDGRVMTYGSLRDDTNRPTYLPLIG